MTTPEPGQLADELERLLTSFRRPNSSAAEAFALRSHLVAHIEPILAALRTERVDAGLVEHIAEQITFAETRIQDGLELGATVWRLALEDIVRENRAALSASAIASPVESNCILCVGKCRTHSLGDVDSWKPEPGSLAYGASPVEYGRVHTDGSRSGGQKPDDLIERLDAIHVWPQIVAAYHAEILSPRQIAGLYQVGAIATEAVARIEQLTFERNQARDVMADEQTNRRLWRPASRPNSNRPSSRRTQGASDMSYYEHFEYFDSPDPDLVSIPRADLLAAVEALAGVIRVADRKTVEFDAARTALAKLEGL